MESQPKYALSFHLTGSIRTETPIPVPMLQEFDRRIVMLISVHLHQKLPDDWKHLDGYLAMQLHHHMKSETSNFSIPKKDYHIDMFRMISEVDEKQADNKSNQEVEGYYAFLMDDTLFSAQYELKLLCFNHKLTQYPGTPWNIPKPHYELQLAFTKIYQKHAQYIKEDSFDVVLADHAIKKVLKFVPKLFGEVLNRTTSINSPKRLKRKRRRFNFIN